MKHYNYGLKAEDRLAGALRRRGYATGYSERSRGPADITATLGGRRLAIQAKAVRTSTARIPDAQRAEEHVRARLTQRALDELIDHAGPGWQAAVALTNGDYYWTWRVHDHRNGHRLELLHDGYLPTRGLKRV